jgi:hydroxymethylbilane synthase
MRSKVVIATRGSQLALWQSTWIAGRLREVHPGLVVELMILRTSGDRFQEASLQAIGGKGAFTKEITEAVLARSADLAVHSLKDLPTQAEPGLQVWAYPPRFDVRDAWFGRDGRAFADLREGDVVASGSLRRSAQLLHHHPGVGVEPIRGNLDTRLRKFEEGTMTGMFLALAGLQRLELTDRMTEALEPSLFLPAPGQGALAVEGRMDAETEALLSPLDDAETRDRVTAERGLLAELEAGCQVPVGALARIEGPDLVLEALISSLDGVQLFRDERRGPPEQAEEIGRTLARDLLDRGGREILDAIREIPS